MKPMGLYYYTDVWSYQKTIEVKYKSGGFRVIRKAGYLLENEN